jgi:uncharacterized membrane protein HdeD (DUF308 family)
MSGSTATAPAFRVGLRNLYVIRFAFALIWAAIVFVAAGSGAPILTVLVVLYPLADAAAVLWQLRSEGSDRASRVPEWINVVLSVVAAILLGWASTVSVGALLTVWGLWAIASGIVQLITAVLRRKLGGQIPLIVSGAISILAGVAFATSQATSGATGIGGYAILGGVFFLIAAIRLTVLSRTSTR